MSPEHENITNNYNLLNDPDKVLEMAKACGETVYKFCLQRMNYESTKGVNVFNGSRCCKSIIDLHNKVRRKDLLNLALESVLKKEPNKWNSYVVVSVYNNFVKEKIEFPLFHNSCDTENLKLFKIENKGSQLWKESNTQPILRRRSYLNFYC